MQDWHNKICTTHEGTLEISKLAPSFPHLQVAGLRYRTEEGTWRGLRTDGDIMYPPPGGWGDRLYVVVADKRSNRTVDDQENYSASSHILRQASDEDEIPFLEDKGNGILAHFYELYSSSSSC